MRELYHTNASCLVTGAVAVAQTQRGRGRARSALEEIVVALLFLVILYKHQATGHTVKSRTRLKAQELFLCSTFYGQFLTARRSETAAGTEGGEAVR